MKKVLVPVISNFEATELITTLNVLKRNDIDYFLWSVEGIDLVNSNREALILTSSIFPQNEDFDALFIPGGPGVEKMKEFEEIYELIQNFNNNNKIIAAICAAPSLLKTAGVLEGKTFTSFPGINLEGSSKQPFEVDGSIVTGRDYSVTQEFAQAFVDILKK